MSKIGWAITSVSSAPEQQFSSHNRRPKGGTSFRLLVVIAALWGAAVRLRLGRDLWMKPLIR
jgi:hypothetical protein